MKDISKLFTIVISTNQTSTTFEIIFTISFTFITRSSGRATFSFINISSLTSWFFLCLGTALTGATNNFHQRSCRFYTAVIFWMEDVSKLFTVVYSTNQISITIKVTLAIPFTFLTGIIICTTFSFVHIPSLASFSFNFHNIVVFAL